MDHRPNDDGETSFDTFVDDVAFEPTYSQALPTAAGCNNKLNKYRGTLSGTYFGRQKSLEPEVP